MSGNLSCIRMNDVILRQFLSSSFRFRLFDMVGRSITSFLRYKCANLFIVRQQIVVVAQHAALYLCAVTFCDISFRIIICWHNNMEL